MSVGTGRFRWPRRLVMAGLFLAFAVLLTSCGSLGGAQNTFAPEGDAADLQRTIFFMALWPAIVILFLVTGVLLYALLRFRRRREDEPPPKQVHGNVRLELAWTVAPAILLLVLAGPVIWGIVELAREPEEALQVRVTASQWKWDYEYPEILVGEEEPLKVSGGDLVIPVDRDILVTLTADDVIHSFWVPKLAGKQDAIPGRENKLRFKASEEGTFSGQCAEFCGIGHANMRITVVVQSEAEFQDWVEAQRTAQASAGAGR